MIGAGLLAKKAVERGLTRKPWVKTSLAPGSKVVTEYYEKAGLTPYLEALGFNTVGYGCTTCIGNSGPLPAEVSRGDRRGRPRRLRRALRQPQLRGARPPRGEGELPRLAAARRRLRARRADGHRHHDRAARARPGRRARLPRGHLAVARRGAGDDRAPRSGARCSSRPTPNVYEGEDAWRELPVPTGELFEWEDASTYVRRPPYFDGMAAGRGHDRGHQRRALPRLDRRLGHDRPHLARRLDQARLARRATTSSSTASSAATSTRTARGAATTR